tara:strand:- start:12482 stop:13168 length:687 start_codon:yes stop_codon:yes gene_type:complete
MNILILGSTSGVGQSVTYRMAKDNNLFLIGRSRITLEKIGQKAFDCGALNVEIIEFNLSKNISSLISKINKVKIDLFINMASSTSSLKDEEINQSIFLSSIISDLINPIKLVEWLVQKNNKVKIIFISSILSRVHTPNRIIYSSLKVLQEKLLNKIKCKILIIIIGTQLEKRFESNKSIALANKIFEANQKNKNLLFFGLYGRALWLLYNINPVFTNLLIRLKRKITK